MSCRAALLLPVLLALGQCAPPPPPVGQARADAATLTACREHADAVYDRQHRDTIYSITERRHAVFGQLHARPGRSRPAAALWLREHDTRLRAQHRHRNEPLADHGTGTNSTETAPPPPGKP